MEIKIKKKTVEIIGLVFLAVVILFGLQFLLSGGENNSDINGVSSTTTETEQSGDVDKIQVVHFHATQQCWSCITVGEYAEKTIKEKFPEEYESGKIEYYDLNVESVENMDMTEKFGAGGSSLYINVIKNGEDNIHQDYQVWRLVTNEQSFINYFENKLKGYL